MSGTLAGFVAGHSNGCDRAIARCRHSRLQKRALQALAFGRDGLVEDGHGIEFEMMEGLKGVVQKAHARDWT